MNFSCLSVFVAVSVVISFLFSGTIQTKLGLFLIAILSISKFAAISKLIGINLFDIQTEETSLEDIFVKIIKD